MDSHSKNETLKMARNRVFKLQMVLANPLSQSFKRFQSAFSRSSQKKKIIKTFGNETAKVKDRVSFNRETVIRKSERKCLFGPKLKSWKSNQTTGKQCHSGYCRVCVICLGNLFRREETEWYCERKKKMEKEGRVMFICQFGKLTEMLCFERCF